MKQFNIIVELKIPNTNKHSVQQNRCKYISTKINSLAICYEILHHEINREIYEIYKF